MGKIKTTKTKQLIWILLICLSIAAATADLATEKVEIVNDKVNLDVNYQDFNDEDQTEMISTTEQFTIKNNNPNSVEITITATGLPSGYSTENKQVTIEGNATLTASLNVNVTHKESSGEKNIGLVVVRGANNLQLDSATLTQITESMLVIEELKVAYTNTKESSKKDTFDRDEDKCQLDQEVNIGSTVTLTFDIKNLFDQDYDEDASEIENIKLTIDTSDNDLFADDFEEEYELNDLGANENQDYEVAFEVSEDAEEGDYTLDLTLEGEDANGAEHKIEKELKLEVARPKDDVRIASAKIVPEKVETCSQQFSVELKLQNYGTAKQRYAAVTIYNAELGINERWNDVTLEDYNDPDNVQSKTFTFSLPKEVEAKSYSLDLNAYIDTDEPIDFQKLELMVEACVSSFQNESTKEANGAETTASSGEVITSTFNLNQAEEDNANSVKLTKDNTTNNNAVSSAIIETIESGYNTEDLLIGVFIAAIILVLVVIILFCAILLKK